MIRASGPLHGYELMFLRSGGVLVRSDSRHPYILMWLTTVKGGDE